NLAVNPSTICHQKYRINWGWITDGAGLVTSIATREVYVVELNHINAIISLILVLTSVSMFVRSSCTLSLDPPKAPLGSSRSVINGKSPPRLKVQGFLPRCDTWFRSLYNRKIYPCSSYGFAGNGWPRV